MTKVFISYSHQDFDCANEIRRLLTSAGYDVWKDVEDIPIFSEWPTEIEEGIEQCDKLIVLWSRNARQSRWVPREITYADALKKPMLPIVLDDTRLPILLIDIQPLRAGPSCLDLDGHGLFSLLDALDRSVSLPSRLITEERTALVGALKADAQGQQERQRILNDQARQRVVNKSVRRDFLHTFHDRSTEIDWLRQQLAQPGSRLVAVIGREGFGKTSLVARMLADAEKGSVTLGGLELPVIGVAYFHPKRTGLALETLFSDFAALLGDPYAARLDSIWRSDLSLAQKANALLEQMMRVCRGNEILFVVVDGLDTALDDRGRLLPSYKDFELWLTACLETESPVKLLVTSSQDWHPPEGTFPFVKQRLLSDGLPEADALALLHELRAGESSRVQVETDVLRKVIHLTGGVPRALIKVAGMLSEYKPYELQELLDEPGMFDREITAVLVDFAYQSLEAGERRVMEVLATYRVPVSTPAITYVLRDERDAASIKESLRTLERRYFVFYNEEQRNWAIHDADRAQVEMQMQERPADSAWLHRQAGQYFETFGLHVGGLHAVYHYQQAGEHELAAQLATADTWTLITRGQASELRQRLEHFDAQQMDPTLWILVQISLGDVYRFLSEVDLARGSYQAALSLLEGAGQTPGTSALRARACLGLGDLARQESLPEARAWLQQGLSALDGAAQPLLPAELNIKLGTVLAELHDYQGAIAATSAGLAQLPDEESQLRVRGLINLGRSYFWGEGDSERGRDFTEQAVTMAAQIGDLFWSLKALNNLALICDLAGQWPDAQATYEAALELEGQIGSPPGEALQLANNLSVLYTNMGQFDEAMAQVQRAENIARRHGLQRDLAYVLTGQADLAERMEQWDAAGHYLAEAEQLTESTGANELRPELYYLWSNACRGFGQLHEAVEYAQRALQLAKDPYTQGKAQRALAQALLVSGQIGPALEAFEKSLSLLQEQDPYETARTRATYGQALVDLGERDRGKELLLQAQSEFRRLGVTSGLASAAQPLNAD
jgi:tetratricopeptide (TPR) repeat protein